MKFNIFEKYLNKYFIKQIKESEINLCNNEKFYIETLFNKKDIDTNTDSEENFIL